MKDLSPEARQLLESARHGDSPSAADRVRMRRALSTAVAAGGLSTSASAAAATKTALGGVSAGAAKSGIALWLALGAATGLATSAAVFVAAPAWKAHAVESARQPAAQPGKTAPAAQAPARVAISAIASATVQAHDEPAAAPTTSLAATEPFPAAASAAQGTPHKNKRAPENGTTDDVSRAAPAETAAEPETPGHGEPPAVAAAARSAPSSLGAETALLENARAALGRGDAAGALALLDEHERDFPRGVLVEERLAARVFALCGLGRTAEAERVAERLLRHSPSSPLRARVLQSCAGPR
jgi:hypothetical protein